MWIKILKQIFHFGGNKSSMKSLVSKLNETQISKQEYYNALTKSLKKELDVIKD